jgi:hypothetical protein
MKAEGWKITNSRLQIEDLRFQFRIRTTDFWLLFLNREPRMMFRIIRSCELRMTASRHPRMMFRIIRFREPKQFLKKMNRRKI